MPTGVTRARRQLHGYMQGDGNWRLKGLYLAGLRTTRVSEEDVAAAWPQQKSDFKGMSRSLQEHERYAPGKKLAVEEDSDEFRQLSDALDKSHISDGPSDQKVINMDRAIPRALFAEDTIDNLDVLWRQELRDTVIEGARKMQVARDAASVINVETKSGDHPRGQDDTFAPDVAEGAAIRDDAEDPDTVSWSAPKWGQGARATEELIDHALVDVIERNIERIGRACENTLNRKFLNELLNNVDTNNDVDGSAQADKGIDSIAEAIKQIENNDFMPDTIVYHPTYARTLLDTSGSGDNILFANQAGTDDGLRDGTIFPVLGLMGHKLSDGVYDPNGSATWDFSSANETGAVVYPQERVNIYMYRDIEVKDYEDPIRDLEGVNARMQADVVWEQQSAGARIQHS